MAVTGAEQALEVGAVAGASDAAAAALAACALSERGESAEEQQLAMRFRWAMEPFLVEMREGLAQLKARRGGISSTTARFPPAPSMAFPFHSTRRGAAEAPDAPFHGHPFPQPLLSIAFKNSLAFYAHPSTAPACTASLPHR